MYSLFSGEVSSLTKEIFLACRSRYVTSYVKDFLDILRLHTQITGHGL
jgi:hypothetical protein